MGGSKHKIKKVRVDELLIRLELAADLNEARLLIMSGAVRVGTDHLIRNSSELFPEDTLFNIETPCPYVSRGAYKLKPALERYFNDLNGMSALDVGASTGGFTDLMLQSGMHKVYTVDSGRGQLHGKLRDDARVVCHEQVNARSLPDDFLPEAVDIITMDVSFISVMKILPCVNRFLKTGGYAFILVKPQFEAERHEIAKGGVVRDEAVRLRCVDTVSAFAAAELGWAMQENLPCEIKGPKGNQEYMCVFRKENT